MALTFKGPLAFQQLLAPATVRAITSMPLLAQQIADRWALGWKGRLLALEADGTLLARLTTQYELERCALEMAATPEYAHLADHEKLALLGPPPGL